MRTIVAVILCWLIGCLICVAIKHTVIQVILSILMGMLIAFFSSIYICKKLGID